MTSHQLVKLIARCEADIVILRQAQAILERHAQRRRRRRARPPAEIPSRPMHPATKPALKRNGPLQKGDPTQTLIAILKDAGQPMHMGELLASVKKAGGRATPQLIGSALRHKTIVRTGKKGPGAFYGLPA